MISYLLELLSKSLVVLRFRCHLRSWLLNGFTIVHYELDGSAKFMSSLIFILTFIYIANANIQLPLKLQTGRHISCRNPTSKEITLTSKSTISHFN